MPLSDSDILNLWQDKNFLGSFSGVKNLQKFLFTDYHEHIPLQRLYNLLKKSPDYLMNLRPSEFKIIVDKFVIKKMAFSKQK